MCCCLLLFVCSLSTGWAAIDTSESQQRYFDGLRDRQLFQLAELLCQQQLADETLNEAERVFYQIEFAKTLGLHAQTVPLQESDELWAEAESRLAAVPAGFPQRDIQQALLRAARADQWFTLARDAPANADFAARCSKFAAAALPALQQAEQQLTTLLDAGRLPENLEQLRTQLDEVRLGRARILLHQAELTASSSDREKLVREARNVLQPYARQSGVSLAAWTARVLELRAARLRQDEVYVEEFWKRLSVDGVPRNIRQQATAEYARYLLAIDQPTQAAETILEQSQIIGSLPGELEALRLQALLRMASIVRARNNERLANELENEVTLRLSKLRERGADYYAWVVENQQRQMELRVEYGPELAAAVQSARVAVNEENWLQAIDAYSSALAAAINNGNLQAAVAIAPEAAGIYFRQGRYADAASQLERVWRSSPSLEGMEQIHLLWIQALGRNYMAARSSERLARYADSLEDHLKRYSERETAAEALWLMAELQFARMQVTRALELYQKVPADSPRGVFARLREGQCYQWIVQRVRDLGQPVTAWELGAEAYAEQVLKDWQTRPIDSSTAAELQLLACRFLLQADSLDRQQLQRVLGRVLAAGEAMQDGTAEERTRWQNLRQRALALRSVALAQSGRVREAADLLREAGPADGKPSDLLFLVQELNATRPASPESQVALAELSLELTEELAVRLDETPPPLNPQDTATLLRLRAEAHLEAGRITPAIDIYEELCQRLPGSRADLLRLSELYERCGNRDCAERHYELWQQQAQREQQGSPAWLAARLQLADLALQTDRLDEARKIVQMTELLYLHVATQEQQEELRELAARIARQSN